VHFLPECCVRAALHLFVCLFCANAHAYVLACIRSYTCSAIRTRFSLSLSLSLFLCHLYNSHTHTLSLALTLALTLSRSPSTHVLELFCKLVNELIAFDRAMRLTHVYPRLPLEIGLADDGPLTMLEFCTRNESVLQRWLAIEQSCTYAQSVFSCVFVFVASHSFTHSRTRTFTRTCSLTPRHPQTPHSLAHMHSVFLSLVAFLLHPPLQLSPYVVSFRSRTCYLL
jgi:hypothetical protein